MVKRVLMGQKLRDLLGPTIKVYFQPPSGLELDVPCCVYTFEDQTTRPADNDSKYLCFETYNIKLIVKTDLEPMVDLLLRTSGFRFVTSYPSGILTHFIFKFTI